jgi:site-specific recombinase XerD
LNLIASWIRRFLFDHLTTEIVLTRNTQSSYRDTLMCLLQFASHRSGVAIECLSLQELAPETVREFLEHVEQGRSCNITTRNHRLSVIHSLAHFIGMHAIEAKWCDEIASIPFKECSLPAIDYLEGPEIETLIAECDPHTRVGARDRALLLFLYNTGARAAEVARLKICDLRLDSPQSVRITGVGTRLRICPLWPATVALLRPLVDGHSPGDAVFRCLDGKPMTRFGIYGAVTSYAKAASRHRPSLAGKRITPHTLRNTAAVHLLRDGAGDVHLLLNLHQPPLPHLSPLHLTAAPEALVREAR